MFWRVVLKKSKIKLEYDGKKLNFDMLRNVWECDAGKMEILGQIC